MLYEVSRSIYRSVAVDILPDRYGDVDGTNHLRVLKAYFPLVAQRRVWESVEHYMRVAEEYVDSLPKTGYDLNGRPIQCRATTRRGTACQRVPLAHNGYCPSHQHLAATEHALARMA